MSSHAFEEDRERSSCDFCGDLWPAAELVSRFYVCAACGLSAHKGCQLMASTCEPCGSGTPRKHLRRSSSSSSAWGILNMQNKQKIAQRPVNGIVVAKILNAHDITETTDTSLYCILKLISTSGESEIRTDVACPSANGDCSFKLSEAFNSSLCLEEAMWGVGEGKNEIPSISLTMWRSTWFTLLDTSFASCNISLFPLLFYPNVATQRMFSIRDIDGKVCGRLTLELSFIPSAGAAGAASPSPSTHTHTPASATSTGDRPRTVSDTSDTSDMSDKDDKDRDKK